ncbi:MAG: hypothetical protein UZ22_OP11002000207 [Microgenomates bacterium OLB23]|nr:MAG: hypothetical protein UZ22_OP11002000207 [Microgenomates bacterium OLB23]
MQLNARIEVFAKPQDSMRDVIKQRFEVQKKYLLTGQDLWNIDAHIGDGRIQSLTNARTIYDFVVNELSYSFDRVEKGNKR